jgi:hypothetical protein
MNPDSYNSSMPQFIKYENSYKYIDDQSKIQSKKCDKCNKYYEINTTHVCNNTSFTFGSSTPTAFGNSNNAQSQFTFGSSNNTPSQFTFGSSNNTPSQFTFGSKNNTPSQFTFGSSTPTAFGSSSHAPSQFTFGSSTPTTFGNSNNAQSQFTFGSSNNAPFTFGSINNTSSKKLKYTNSSPSYMS